MLRDGRLVWRSQSLYPNDGGSVAFGPGEFAFASYRRGVFLTDLTSGERLVVRGRGLFPYEFTSGGATVTYSLYSDSGHSTVWGNTIGSDTVTGTGSGSPQSFTVYGRVPPQATAAPGTYNDTITVTVTY